MHCPKILLSAGTLAMLAVMLPGGVSAQQQAPTAVQLPSGAYVIMLRDIDSVPATMVGQWQVVFDTAGVYRMLHNGAAVVLGKYTIKADTLLIVDTGGEMACVSTGVVQPATYIWKMTPDGMALVAVNDWCTGRRRMTTIHPLVKVKPN